MKKVKIKWIDGKSYIKGYTQMVGLDIKKIAPIDCVGGLFLNENNVLNKLFNLEDIIKSNAYFNNTPQHLHILTDEPIKRGDWVYNKISKRVYVIYHEDEILKYEYKIIASTDKTLGVGLIHTSFILTYLNNYNKGKAHELDNVWIEVEKPFAIDNIIVGNYKIKKTKNGIIMPIKVKNVITREEAIDFAEKYARMVMEKNMLNGYKKIHNRKWIEDNL